jgi:hypothetical protein
MGENLEKLAENVKNFWQSACLLSFLLIFQLFFMG